MAAFNSNSPNSGASLNSASLKSRACSGYHELFEFQLPLLRELFELFTCLSHSLHSNSNFNFKTSIASAVGFSCTSLIMSWSTQYSSIKSRICDLFAVAAGVIPKWAATLARFSFFNFLRVQTMRHFKLFNYLL